MKVSALFVLFLCLISIKLKSQTSQELSDTIHYDIVLEGRSNYQQKHPIILTNDNEYFEFYYNFFGTYPKNFKFNFDKEMIVVFFKTLTSGSFKLSVDYIIETQDKIEIILKAPSNGFHTCDMNPSYIALSLKKSEKQIIMN